MKNGCITSGVASPSCRMVNLSMILSRGLYARPAALLFVGNPGDGGRGKLSSTGLEDNEPTMRELADRDVVVEGMDAPIEACVLRANRAGVDRVCGRIALAGDARPSVWPCPSLSLSISSCRDSEPLILRVLVGCMVPTLSARESAAWTWSISRAKVLRRRVSHEYRAMFNVI